MQNRYAGDIGDYIKLAILRTLAPGRQLGVLWWLYPDEGHNSDGKHVGYLAKPDLWRRYDPALFDELKAIVDRSERNVSAIEMADLIPDAVYVSACIRFAGPAAARAQAREAWLSQAAEQTADCDLLFLDPDNGLETKNFRLTAPKAGKSVALSELVALRRPGRAIIVYHHQTRMRGGHAFELEHWGTRLRAAGFTSVDALRASAYSARAFFILDGDEALRRACAEFASHWRGSVTWHPDLGLTT